MSNVAAINQNNQISSTANTSRSSIIKSLIPLLGTMPTQGASDANMAMRLDTYADVLGDLAPEKVADACKKFLRGEWGDGRFAPTPAQIRQSVTDPCFGQHDLRFTPDDRLTNEQYWAKRRQLKEWGAA